MVQLPTVYQLQSRNNGDAADLKLWHLQHKITNNDVNKTNLIPPQYQSKAAMM